MNKLYNYITNLNNEGYTNGAEHVELMKAYFALKTKYDKAAYAQLWKQVYKYL